RAGGLRELNKNSMLGQPSSFSRDEHQRTRPVRPGGRADSIPFGRGRAKLLPAYSHVGGAKHHESRHCGGSTELGRGAGHPRRRFGNGRCRRSDTQTRGQPTLAGVPWPSFRQSLKGTWAVVTSVYARVKRVLSHT